MSSINHSKTIDQKSDQISLIMYETTLNFTTIESYSSVKYNVRFNVQAKNEFDADKKIRESIRNNKKEVIKVLNNPYDLLNEILNFTLSSLKNDEKFSQFWKEFSSNKKKGDFYVTHIHPDKNNTSVESVDIKCENYGGPSICVDLDDFQHPHFMCMYLELLKIFFFSQYEYWSTHVNFEIKQTQEFTVTRGGHSE